ncbi:universal stress protein [Companilactobacillus ginsenosidimutans]|uniref:Universal stress protein UspA n=1 Tax=Companilactobacillus ginsenosidimutans TaxID=1007676 RepID=A0A0H4QHX2_9LACO|nr:universal stress protein [Companilactobacillus ginsenosidimutans]AKP67999.1 universal stress protein UspA [Companilactobacillus ginsenosidimutans]
MIEVYKRILVAVDNSYDSKVAFDYAVYRASLDDCILDIASVVEDNDFNAYEILSKQYMSEKRLSIEQTIQSYKRIAEDDGVKEVNTFITEGDDEAGEIICKNLIPVIKPDLLVVGSKSEPGVRSLFGSQASYMVKHAPISVLVVRN